MAALRRLPVRPLRLHRLRLLAGRAVPRSSWPPAADQLARSAWRCAASARTRAACPRSARRAGRTSATVYTSPRSIAGAPARCSPRPPRRSSLDVLSFQRSADVAGDADPRRRRPALRRADRGASSSWSRATSSPASTRSTGTSGSALLLVVVVLLSAERHPRRARPRCWPGGSGRPERDRRPVHPRACDKSFGSLVVADDIDARRLPHGARHALIGPNGAGKTTLINLMTGMLPPDARAHLPRRRRRSPTLAAATRASSAAWRAPSRSTRCSRTSRALEAVTLAVCEREACASVFWRRLPAYRDAIDEAHADPRLAPARRQRPPPDRELAYGQQRLLEIALALATRPRCCCSTSPRPACPGTRARSCSP